MEIELIPKTLKDIITSPDAAMRKLGAAQLQHYNRKDQFFVESFDLICQIRNEFAEKLATGLHQWMEGEAIDGVELFEELVDYAMVLDGKIYSFTDSGFSQSLIIGHNIKNGKFILPFAYWVGDFYCSNKNLNSLEGSPEQINGSFTCNNNSLRTLEGGPKKVTGNYSCTSNILWHLRGAPEYVGGSFFCWDNKLETLWGAPLEVGGSFSCFNNPKLKSAKWLPEKLGGVFTSDLQ